VNEIRSKWAANEYDLVFSGKVVIESNGQYNILKQQTDNNKSMFRLKTSDDINTNDILKTVMKSGNVISFNPALPSMNEIFLRVIETRNQTI
jgi:ABC-type uncharacterized transport system ATPase subunit